MRQNGVNDVFVAGLTCGHEADNLDHLPGHLTVPSLSGRMKCSACGSKRSMSALGHRNRRERTASLAMSAYAPTDGVIGLQLVDS